MLNKLPGFTKNKYFLTGVLFLFWMIFLDSNDFVSQYKLGKRVKTLKNEKEYFQQKIQEVRAEREELLSNPDLLEKFAREKYLMKRPEEDLFIIEVK